MPTKEHDERVTQALAQGARLGGYTLKKVSTSDDLANRILTVTLTGIIAGFVQENLDFEREDLTAHVNGRGEVEKIDGLIDHPSADPTDLTETDETQAAAPNENIELVGTITDTGTGETTTITRHTPLEGDPPPSEHRLVGEAAAVARRRRRLA